MAKSRCKLCNSQYAIGNVRVVAQGKKGRVNNYCFPKILSCGHIFCEECVNNKLLTSSSDGNGGHIHTLTCAVTSCQASSVLTDDELKALPVLKHLIGSIALEDTVAHRHIDNLLKLSSKTAADLLKENPSQAEKCLHCRSAAAQVVCEKCDGVHLCRKCFTDLHKSVIFASHKPLELSKAANKSPTQMVNLKIDAKCSEHPQKAMEYFCKDCRTAMCGDCGILGSHSGHSFSRLSVVNKEVKSKLLEARRKAGKAVDVVKHTRDVIATTNRYGNELAGGGDGPGESATTRKINEVFLHLHALLQLKQREVEEKVGAAAGNNKSALRHIDKELTCTQVTFEHLVSELDRLLSDQTYDNTCDFTRVNAEVQKLFELPCHLVVNDVSQAADLEISINREILSSMSDLVSVSAQSNSVERYELKKLEDMSESELESIPSTQKSTANVHDYQSTPISLGHAGDSEPGCSSISLSSQSSRYRKFSDQSQISFDYAHGGRQPPVIDPYSQQNRRVHHPPPTQPFYEDNFSGISSFGDTPSHNSQSDRGSYGNQRRQQYGSLSPNPHADLDRLSSASNDATWTTAYSPTSPPYRPPYAPTSPHRHGARGQRPHIQSPTARPATPSGGSYENYELAARQHSTPTKPADFQHMFGARDVRLENHMYQPSEGYAASNNPVRPGGLVGKQLVATNRSGGRGRDVKAPLAPLDVQALQPGPQKKLYMHDVEPFIENSLSVKVTHVESPVCIYVQHPSKVKALHKIKQKIVEHCESSPPLANLRDVKFVLARVKGTWRRGEVVQILERAVRVFCCDYGYTADILPQDLRPTYGGLLCVPKQAVKCHLQGIQPADGSCEWPAQCANEMKYVMDKMSGVTLVKLDSKLVEADSVPVDLLMRDQTTITTLSLRDYLVFSELAVWDCPAHPYIPDQKILTKAFPSLTPICAGMYMRMFVSHVVSPDEFYAQIVNREFDDSLPKMRPDQQSRTLAELMLKMNERYSAITSNMLHKVFVPKPGDAVAAFYEGEWFRANILALQPSHVKVKYVDYGNIEVVPKDQIRVLFNDCKILPAQAVRLQLHGVAPLSGKKWSKKICEGFSELCVEMMCRCKIVGGNLASDNLSAVMVMEDTGENMGNLLVQTGLAKRADDSVSEDEGVDYTWTHIESPSEVYVRTEDMALKAEELVKQMTTVLEEGDDSSMKKEEWKAGETCAVKHGGKWARATVLSVKETSKCKLQLMDSGIEIVKTFNDLRIPPEIASGPALIQVASIAGIAPSGDGKLWGPTAKDTIKELMEPYESFKLVPKEESLRGVLLCDFLLPMELPRKYLALPAEIRYTSVKAMLLDSGVALRKDDTRTTSEAKKTTKPSTAANFSKNLLVEKMSKSRSQTPTEEKAITPSQNSSVSGKEESGADEMVEAYPSQKALDARQSDVMPVAGGLSGDTYTTEYSGATSTTSQPVTVDISNSVVTTRTTFRPSGVGGTRLMKSPGGTIRSEAADPSTSTSQGEKGSTEHLLEEAANRLAVDFTPKVVLDVHDEEWDDDSSSGSSSDVPTPELQMTLNRLVGNPNLQH